jgi:hypothetical protein
MGKDDLLNIIKYNHTKEIKQFLHYFGDLDAKLVELILLKINIYF